MIKLLRKIFCMNNKQYIVVKVYHVDAISKEHAENRCKIMAPTRVTVARRP